MGRVEKSIQAAVPVRQAYNQWTQFETFPKFMEGVTSVRQVDDTHLHWTASIAGREIEWDAEVTEQRPDEVVAWRSTSGAQNAGAVTFRRMGPDRTEVTLRMEVDPEGPIETAGEAAGLLDRQVEADLERFKDFIEGRRVATGGWRGSVDDGEPTGSRS
jgi:uncharacterized membrane protein